MIRNKHKVLTRVSVQHSFPLASDRVWPKWRAFLKKTQKVLRPDHFLGHFFSSFWDSFRVDFPGRGDHFLLKKTSINSQPSFSDCFLGFVISVHVSLIMPDWFKNLNWHHCTELGFSCVSFGKLQANFSACFHLHLYFQHCLVYINCLTASWC